eukprot:CAMPEP_0202857402 /NCGR_PEP_ID=MMETSP1391-20130828/353_1 /ASSEMBLY_ACC=CAM_ASM_000867 /TAXON_ID=1034604 /ORGANISM="Chlamydomonas leiostraca, Strain SAG 11-49" /LENGTH=1154 /DNA_ID=CAMNT_0049536193 /DNA_START=185 /DNA_END=3649 /DNA_ORIENTATION=-
MGAPDLLVTVEAKDAAISPDELVRINKDKDLQALRSAGGAQGLIHAANLGTDLHHGLPVERVEANRARFGANVFPGRPPPSFLAGFLDAIQDPMIVILLIVAIITIIVGAAVPEQRAHNGWSEGIAVLVTALVVVFIAAGQDYNKELQFQKLNKLKDLIDIKVIRGGKQCVVPNTELVVGDIVLLDTGDKIVADGLCVLNQGLVVDEASLTGESDPIKKNTEDDPWCRSGTTVNEGAGRILLVAVGPESEWGRTMALVSEAGDDMTPLQEQLKDLATKISKFGVTVAVVCFLALFIKWLVVNKGWNNDKVNDNGPLQFLLYAITITVVSIPEGLPLAVTLTLAYSMKKMMKDNNFVRVLSACETMGGATAVCSDKTGTLTENRMTVVEGWFAGRSYGALPAPSDLPDSALTLLAHNCALNSKAFLVDQPNGTLEFIGNRTECALLVLARKLGHDYTALRDTHTDDVVRVYGFSSARKMASVVTKDSAAPAAPLRLHTKGAAEWVLAKCSAVVSAGGAQVPMTEPARQQLYDIVTQMASRGLRCICLAYRDLPGDVVPGDDPEPLVESLVCYAIVGIKDPVRQEVPGAVATCQRAGVVVRMVTGDNIHTARHIARECGLFDEAQGHVALEGPVFRTMPAAELMDMLPRLRVLARSSPEDKLTLVRLLKGQGEVVAVTGDGTNDAPALKESDVGLAMGIAGTEVAKEAADIIILDDNFNSIVKSVLWGRCVYMNIRKFLVFQLSVNAVALVSAFVGAIAGGVPPLNVLQLLWVNMIMDTLAALALATENPYPELLDDPPHGRHEPLITPTMWLHIITSSMYKLFWLFCCLYALPRVVSRYTVLTKHEYLLRDCVAEVAGEGFNATTTASVCNYMQRCGFPTGADTRNSPLCELHAQWTAMGAFTVPGNAREAICLGQPGNCPMYNEWRRADKHMEDEWERELKDEMKPALSVLFNSFIMAQIFNAFVSRRIGLECDFFKGVWTSPIFMGIMVFITVLQVIIMQTPLGNIFKVEPLDWKEWLACIAIGLGVFPYSWLVRLGVRGLIRAGCVGTRVVDALRGPRMAHYGRPSMSRSRENSGRPDGGHSRTASGRTPSGKTWESRTASGKPGTEHVAHHYGGGSGRTTSGKPVELSHTHQPSPLGPKPNLGKVSVTIKK